MYPYANTQLLDVRPSLIQGDLAAASASAFLQQPWPPLAPGILQTSLMMLAAAAPGGWLAGIVPAMLNAAMTPAFDSFASVMQMALPLSESDIDPSGAIMFASALSEFGITDLIVAEGGVPGPLLATLREPGQSKSWELPGRDGKPITATFYRVDVPTDDGSWLIQADLSHGERTISSQLVRANEVIANPRDPQTFHDGVSRAHAAWTRRSADGQDARMAIVCEDGAGRSGAAAALMRRMSVQQAHEASGRPGATVPLPELRRADNEFISEGSRRRGPAFARNQEVFLNHVPHRGADAARERPDERAGARPAPPEAPFHPSFVWRQRPTQSLPDTRTNSPTGSHADSYTGSDSDSDFDMRSGSFSDLSSQSGVYELQDEVFDAASMDERLSEVDEVDEGASTVSWHSGASSRPARPRALSDAEPRADAAKPPVARPETRHGSVQTDMTDAPPTPTTPTTPPAMPGATLRPAPVAAPVHPAPPRKSASMPELRLPAVPLHEPGRFDAKPVPAKSANSASSASSASTRSLDRARSAQLRAQRQADHTAQNQARLERARQFALEAEQITARTMIAAKKSEALSLLHTGLDEALRRVVAEPRTGLRRVADRLVRRAPPELGSDVLQRIELAVARLRAAYRAEHRRSGESQEEDRFLMSTVNQAANAAVRRLDDDQRRRMAAGFEGSEGLLSNALSHQNSLAELAKLMGEGHDAIVLQQESRVLASVLGGIQDGLALDPASRG